MAIDKAIEVILSLKDTSFQSGMKAAESQLKSFGDSMNNIGQKAAVGFAGLGAVVLASANSFREFEAGMSNISTIVDTSKESMTAMGQEVLDLSKRMPVGINDLVSGLYDLRSAGIDGAHAMGALEASAKLGVAGLGSVSESVDIMTTAMNAFASEGLSANSIADILFKTTQYGKITVSQMAEAFGTAAPLVKSAGVSLADFSAATAALTAVGVPAAEAQNSIRAAVVALKKPTEEMQKIFTGLGVTSGPQLIQMSGNIGEAFKRVKEEAEKLGIPLEKVTGRVEGAAAMTSLATSANKTYVTSLADMTSGINALDGAYQKQAATFNSAIQLMINNIQVFAIQLGAAMAPALTMAANAIKTVADWFSKLPEPMKGFIANSTLIGTAVLGVVSGLSLLIGNIAGTIASVIAVSAAIAGWVTANAAILESALVIGSFLAGTLGPILIGAVAAVAALAIAWQNNFLGIQTFTKQTVSFIGSVIGDMFKGIGSWFNWVVKAAGDVCNAIGGFFAPWLEKLGSALNSFFDWVGTGITNFGAGAMKFLSWFFGEILKDIRTKAEWAAKVLNPLLEALHMPTINPDGIVNGIKTATDLSIKYFQTKWADAGKLAIKIPAVSKTVASAPGNIPGASTGANPYVAPDEASKKKAVSDATKKDNDAVRSTVDALSNSLKSNKQAMEEVIVGMGAYVSESDKLQAQLIKLDHDEKTLEATRNKLASMHYTGDAEKSRIKALQDVNEQLRQNAIDEKQIQNDLSKARIDKGLTDNLQASESLYDGLISKMGIYGTEAQKLSFQLLKLAKDEESLNDARKKMIADGATSAGLEDINKKIKENAAAQKKAQGELTRAQEKENADKLQAEQKFQETKLRIGNEFKDRQSEHEMSGLKDLYDRKLISEKDFNAEVDRIRREQAEREKGLIDLQLKGLNDQLDIYKAQNANTAERVQLEERIYQLTQQKSALDQINNNKKAEDENKANANDPFSVQSLTETMGQALETFNSTFVQGIVNGNLQIGQSFKNLGISILTDIETKCFTKIKDAALRVFKDIVTGNTEDLAKMTKGFTAFASGVGTIFGKMAGFIGDGFGSLVTLAIGAFKKMFQAAKASAAAQALVLAPSSGQKAYDAVVGIPYIGPVLAPIAYATAFAFQVSKAALIGAASMVGFASGTPELPDDMLAQVHKGEMIVPATFAQGIRSGELTLSGGGGTAKKSEAPATVVQINFEGANFNGVPRQWVDEIEKLLIEKMKLRGSALFGGT